MLLALGQRMLNEQIEVSTAARERLAALDGKRFAVTVKGTDLRVIAESAGGELRLTWSPYAASDVELTAPLLDLAQLARSAKLTDLRNVGASLNGEINVAEGFADLLRLAIPEPDAWLADWIGDMPAHAIGETARHVTAWAGRARRAFELNLAEYLQEENPTLIPPPLARHFAAEVDRIRDDVERTEKRIERLERRRPALFR